MHTQTYIYTHTYTYIHFLRENKWQLENSKHAPVCPSLNFISESVMLTNSPWVGQAQCLFLLLPYANCGMQEAYTGHTSGLKIPAHPISMGICFPGDWGPEAWALPRGDSVCTRANYQRTWPSSCWAPALGLWEPCKAVVLTSDLHSKLWSSSTAWL